VLDRSCGALKCGAQATWPLKRIGILSCSVENMATGEIAALENLGTGTNFLQMSEITSQSPFFLVRLREVFNRAILSPIKLGESRLLGVLGTND